MMEAFREIEVKAAGDADNVHGTVTAEAFQEAERYIGSIPKFVKKNTMEGTKAFYRRLSSPCVDRKVIHVAGTNGKGSVCAYLQSVLMEAGYSVGMFTSPHLADIRERIRVNGEMISEEEFVRVYLQVREYCGLQDTGTERQNKENCGLGDAEVEPKIRGNCRLEDIETEQRKRENCVFGDAEAEQQKRENCGLRNAEKQDAEFAALPANYHPSYFEFLYFMAMLYFEKKQPDFIILETGLGGRLDATNSFASPCISIITEIGLDHTEYLGETIAEIAAEKAGIVKKGIPLVYFANNKISAEVMEKTAKKAETGAFSVKPEEICLKKYDEKGIDFSYYCGYYKYSMFHLATTALYQQENAALCIRALAVLSERGVLKVSGEALRAGLAKAHWEGRMEEILPEVFADGAHNPDGIAAFLKTVQADDSEGGRVLLYSSLKEKALREMTGQIADAGLFEKIIVTEIESDRAAKAEELAALFGGENILVIKEIKDAFAHCLRERDMGKKVYITGSLYLVGQSARIAETARGGETER